MSDIRKRIRLWVVLPVTLNDVKCQCLVDGSLSLKCLFLDKDKAVEYRKKSVYPTVLASVTVTEEEIPASMKVN